MTAPAVRVFVRQFDRGIEVHAIAKEIDQLCLSHVLYLYPVPVADKGHYEKRDLWGSSKKTKRNAPTAAALLSPCFATIADLFNQHNGC